MENIKVKRIQRHRTKGWKMPPNTIYVGRPSKYGNPFQIGKSFETFFESSKPFEPNSLLTRQEAIDAYEYWLQGQLYLNKNFLSLLKGKDLACWCKEDELCHADILIEYANKY
jgi:hypothetical protein